MASEVRTTVQYVSATTVYLAVGRTSGIAPGDSVEITRNDQVVARCVVTFVSDNSTSCELPDAATLVFRGDAAVVRATGSESALQATTDTTEYSEPQAVLPETQERLTSDRSSNRLSGLIGLEYRIQDDREPVNYDYSEPSLRVRGTFSKISGSDITARANLRLRRTFRRNDELSASTHRIYEAMLAYDPADKPLEAGLGRLLLRETRGLGYLDGAYVKYDISSEFGIGAVGGIEPDLQTTRIQTDITKFGAFLSYEKRLAKRQSVQATGSLVGRYREGEVSREFLYQQISYVYGGKLRLFESTEINYNRGWLKDAEGSTLSLASLILDARYRLARALSLSIGYDSRQNYYTIETRTVPDSLFNNALQRGYRISVESRFADSYSAEIGFGLRDSDGNSSEATSGWLQLGTTRFVNTSSSAFARVRWYDSEWSTGVQPSLSLSSQTAAWLRTTVDVGVNEYTLATTEDQISQKWAGLVLDVSVSRQSYAMFEFEQRFGDHNDASIVTVSMGYRF